MSGLSDAVGSRALNPTDAVTVNIPGNSNFGAIGSSGNNFHNSLIPRVADNIDNRAIGRIAATANQAVLQGNDASGQSIRFRINNGVVEYWNAGLKSPKFVPIRTRLPHVDRLIPSSNGGVLALAGNKLYSLGYQGYARHWINVDKIANNNGGILYAFSRENGAIYLVFANGNVGYGNPETKIVIGGEVPKFKGQLKKGDKIFFDKNNNWWRYTSGSLSRYNNRDNRWYIVRPNSNEGKFAYSNVHVTDTGNVIGMYSENGITVQEDIITGIRYSGSAKGDIANTLYDVIYFEGEGEGGQKNNLAIGVDRHGWLTGYVETVGSGKDTPASRIPLVLESGHVITGVTRLRSGNNGTIYFIQDGNIYQTSVLEGKLIAPQLVYGYNLNGVSSGPAIDIAVDKEGNIAFLNHKGDIRGVYGNKIISVDKLVFNSQNKVKPTIKQITYDEQGLIWALTEEGRVIRFSKDGTIFLDTANPQISKQSGIIIPKFTHLSTTNRDGLIRLVDSNGKGYFLASNISNNEFIDSMRYSKAPALHGKPQVVRMPGGKWVETFLYVPPFGNHVTEKKNSFWEWPFRKKFVNGLSGVGQGIRDYFAAHIISPIYQGGKSTIQQVWQKIGAFRGEKPIYNVGDSGIIYRDLKNIIDVNAGLSGQEITTEFDTDGRIIRNVGANGTNIDIGGVSLDYYEVAKQNERIINELKDLISYDAIIDPKNASFVQQLKNEVRKARGRYGYSHDNMIFQVAKSPVLDKKTRSFMNGLLELGIILKKGDQGSILQAKLLENADSMRRISVGLKGHGKETAINKAYSHGFRSFSEVYNLQNQFSGFIGDWQNPNSELSKTMREITGVSRKAGQQALITAFKNKLAALPVGEQITLARNRGVEINLTNKRWASGTVAGPLKGYLYGGPKGHWKIAPSIKIAKNSDGSLSVSFTYGRDASIGAGYEAIFGGGVNPLSVSVVHGVGGAVNNVRASTISLKIPHNNSQAFMDDFLSGKLQFDAMRRMSVGKATISRQSVCGMSTSAYLNGGVNANTPHISVVDDNGMVHILNISIKPLRGEAGYSKTWDNNQVTGGDGIEKVQKGTNQKATYGYGTMAFYAGYVIGPEMVGSDGNGTGRINDLAAYRPIEPYYKKINTKTLFADGVAYEFDFADDETEPGKRKIVGINIKENFDAGAKITRGSTDHNLAVIERFLNENISNHDLQETVGTVIDSAKKGGTLNLTYELTKQGVELYNKEEDGEKWLKKLRKDFLSNSDKTNNLIRIKSLALSASAAHSSAGNGGLLLTVSSSGTITESGINKGAVAFGYRSSGELLAVKRSGFIFSDPISGVTPTAILPGGRDKSRADSQDSRIDTDDDLSSLSDNDDGRRVISSLNDIDRVGHSSGDSGLPEDKQNRPKLATIDQLLLYEFAGKEFEGAYEDGKLFYREVGIGDEASQFRPMLDEHIDIFKSLLGKPENKGKSSHNIGVSVSDVIINSGSEDIGHKADIINVGETKVSFSPDIGHIHDGPLSKSLAFADYMMNGTDLNVSNKTIIPYVAAQSMGITFSLDYGNGNSEVVYGGEDSRGTIVYHAQTDDSGQAYYQVRKDGTNLRIYDTDGSGFFHALNMVNGFSEYSISASRDGSGEVITKSNSRTDRTVSLLRQEMADWIYNNNTEIEKMLGVLDNDIQIRSINDIRYQVIKDDIPPIDPSLLTAEPEVLAGYDFDEVIKPSRELLAARRFDSEVVRETSLLHMQKNNIDGELVAWHGDSNGDIEYSVIKGDKIEVHLAEIDPDNLREYKVISSLSDELRSFNEISDITDNDGIGNDNNINDDPVDRSSSPSGKSLYNRFARNTQRASRAIGIMMAANGLMSIHKAAATGDINGVISGSALSAYGFSELIIDKNGRSLARKIVSGSGKYLARGTEKMMKELAESAASSVSSHLADKLLSRGLTGAVAVRSVSKLMGRLTPLIGVGLGINNMVNSLQDEDKLRGTVNFVLELVATTTGMLAAVPTPLSPFLELISIGFTVGSIVFNGVYSFVKSELDSLPDDATWQDKAEAFFIGLGKGIEYMFYELNPIGNIIRAMQQSKELDKMAQADADLLASLSNYNNYYRLTRAIDQEYGTIDFIGGKASFYGGGIDFSLSSSDGKAKLKIENMSDANGNQETREFDVDLEEVKDIILGIGETPKIEMKEEIVKLLWVFEINRKNVIVRDNNGNIPTIANSNYGKYRGDAMDNIFYTLQDQPKDQQGNPIGADLKDYEYTIDGAAGDDTFFLGPQQIIVTGGDGSDYYVSGENAAGLLLIDNSDNIDDYEMDILDLAANKDQVKAYRGVKKYAIEKDYLGAVSNSDNVDKIIEILNWARDNNKSYEETRGLMLKALSSDGEVNFDYKNYSVSEDELREMVRAAVTYSRSDKNRIEQSVLNNRVNSIFNNVDALLQRLFFTDNDGNKIWEYSSDDLIISYRDINGHEHEVRIKEWFLGEQNQHLQIKTADGYLLSVGNIVDAASMDIKNDMGLISPHRAANQFIDILYADHEVELQAIGYNRSDVNSGQGLFDANNVEYAAVKNITGSIGRDELYGNSQNNIIDGKGGVDDVLSGGDGSDIYIVESYFDRVNYLTIDNSSDDTLSDTVLIDANFANIDLSIDNNNLIIKSTQDKSKLQSAINELEVKYAKFFNSFMYLDVVLNEKPNITINQFSYIVDNNITKGNNGEIILDDDARHKLKLFNNDYRTEIHGTYSDYLRGIANKYKEAAAKYNGEKEKLVAMSLDPSFGEIVLNIKDYNLGKQHQHLVFTTRDNVRFSIIKDVDGNYYFQKEQVDASTSSSSIDINMMDIEFMRDIIEVNGSQYGDSIIGNAEDNLMFGGGNNGTSQDFDYLRGGNGKDTYFYNPETDGLVLVDTESKDKEKDIVVINVDYNDIDISEFESSILGGSPYDVNGSIIIRDKDKAKTIYSDGVVIKNYKLAHNSDNVLFKSKDGIMFTINAASSKLQKSIHFEE